jgi:hypothetical protein
MTATHSDWARRALFGQGNAVLRAAFPRREEFVTFDEVRARVAKAGHDFESHHVTAALENLKGRQLVRVQTGRGWIRR